MKLTIPCFVIMYMIIIVYSSTNIFNELTQEEFAKIYLHPINISSDISKFTRHVNEFSKDTFPESFDWRKKGVVNRIKYQGKCGSCWAFAAVSIIESIVAINDGDLLVLSENQFIECDVFNDGCKGGDISNALLYAVLYGVCSQKYKTNMCDTCTRLVNVTNVYVYVGEDNMIAGLQMVRLLHMSMQLI